MSDIIDISRRLQNLVRTHQTEIEGDIVVTIPGAAFDKLQQELQIEIQKNYVHLANGSKLVLSGEFKLNDVIFRRAGDELRSLTKHAFG